MIDPTPAATPAPKSVIKSHPGSGFLPGFFASLYFAVQPALFMYVIPQLQKIYEDLGVALPQMTVAFIDLSRLLRRGVFDQLQLGPSTVLAAVILATLALAALGLPWRRKRNYLILLHLVGIVGIIFEALALCSPMISLMASASS